MHWHVPLMSLVTSAESGIQSICFRFFLIFNFFFEKTLIDGNENEGTHKITAAATIELFPLVVEISMLSRAFQHNCIKANCHVLSMSHFDIVNK